MLEQELASIIKYTLDTTKNPSPYYYEVPQNFTVPSVYFPTPELTTGGETFLTYSVDYIWFIKLFHKTTQEAYALGLMALTAIKANRNLIPLITETGEAAGKKVRLNDPSLKTLDNGAAQLTLSWRSRRPYNAEEAIKMQRFDVEGWNKRELYTEKNISEAYAEAIKQYSATLPETQQN